MNTWCCWGSFLEANSQAALLSSLKEAEIHPFASLFLPFQPGLSTQVWAVASFFFFFWQHLHFALPKALLTHHLPSPGCAFKEAELTGQPDPGQ